MVTPVEPATTVSLDKPRILVVDDEYGPRESIAFTLSVEFDVDTSGRAADAIAKIANGGYSVVVLDIRMPEMDGIKALEEIRRVDADVSVIMLTGYGTLYTAQQAMVRGANQYLRKPPDIHELIEAVRQQAEACRHRRHQSELHRTLADMNAALKRDISASEPQVWQARAAVELVHDLLNPLMVVIGYSGLLGEEARELASIDPSRADKLRNHAQMVERAAEFCHHLADNWRQTTRRTADFADVDLVALTVEVKQVIFFNNASLHLSGLSSAVVRGSRFELARVLQNLLKNALEAGATTVSIEFSRSEDSYAIVVTDNGAGKDEDTQTRAMRGGFTT